ncbi:hypothetical protein Tco_1031146 [Tanacetum coccineum]|uniref:Retrotransposon gag domain-containing protein n=1 Tax=Tanacetum coccineum TaxID=301880 RepID=A0ABQ5G8M8_9ASTR
MAEPILNENMEKYQIESNLSITSNDINNELNKEFLEEIQMNAYHRWIDEDIVNHIAKVLEMVDLIYVPSMDSHQLRMKVFPLLLVNDAKQWWINEGVGKITIWEELVEKFFCKFYPDSYNGEEEMVDEGDNWGIKPLEFISRDLGSKEISTNIGEEFTNMEILKCWSLETSKQLFNIILLINSTWRIYRANIRGVSHSNSF